MNRVFFLVCFLLIPNILFAADWATNLVWNGGGVWMQRLPLTLENNTQQPLLGTPVAVKLPQRIKADELRLTKSDGTELFYDLSQDGTTLTVPAEVESGKKATYYIYFDNTQAEPLPDALNDSTKPIDVPFEFAAAESIPYAVIPAETRWSNVARNDYACRSTFRIINTTDTDLDNVPVLMTLRGTQAHGLVGTLTDVMLADSSSVMILDPENFRLSCRVSVPAKTIKYFNVYYRFDETKIPGEPLTKIAAKESDTAHPEMQRDVDLLAELPNLVKNGNIEQGLDVDGWKQNDSNPSEGVRYSIERSPELVRFGEQCLRLDIAKDVPPNWRGWTQRIAVEPNRSYLVQGWMKGIDTPPARIHLHFHTADGKFCAGGGMSSVNQDITGTTDWTRVAEIINTPPDARFMIIHLTTNGSGTLLYDNITVIDGLFAEQTDRESFYSADNTPAFWQVPAVMKVFPQTLPPQSARNNSLQTFWIEAARNEKEPLQIAYRCEENGSLYDGTGNFPEIEPPKHSSGFVLNQFEIKKAGYVKIDYPSNYYNTTTPKWYRKSPTSAPGSDGWAGLWADPLFSFQNKISYLRGHTDFLWITWTIPKDAPAGKYTGTFTSPFDEEKKYPIEVIVHDFTLPDENNVSAIYDVRFGPDHAKTWGGSLESFNKPIVETMTANRLSPDALIPSPKLTFQDGKPVFDWTEFDKAADWYFNERKVRQVYMPRLFYLFGWGHPPKEFYGEQPYPGDWPFTGTDFSKLRPEYKAKYQSVLREFWNHLKEKGWAEKFVLYISDEPNYQTPEIITQMKALCEMIHEVDSKIPIYCSTWRYIPDWADSLDVWGIGHYGIVSTETMKEITDHGSRIWFTTDGMLCLDTPYNAIERLMPHYCFKYGADAYEFWGVSWLTYNPYKYGSHAYIHQSSTPGEYYWVRYPNGDGYLLYPPQNLGGDIVSSVRFEQAREGVEDYEYFTLLAQLIEKAKQQGKNVSKAESALNEAKDLVNSPAAIGRFSSKILPNPYRLDEVRRNVAKAIEGLVQ